MASNVADAESRNAAAPAGSGLARKL